MESEYAKKYATSMATARTTANGGGHFRSSSLENSSGSMYPPAKSAMLPSAVSAGFTGTLKSRREQKRISDYLSRTTQQMPDVAGNRKQHFDNIREIFEKNKYSEEVPVRDTDNEPPPISGQLAAGKGKQVIRPIAFKPPPPPYKVTGGDRYGSTPSLMAGTQISHPKFGSTNDLNGTPASYYGTLYRKHAIPFKTYDSLESILKLPDSVTPTQAMSKSAMFHADGFMAPSPSDSGVSELEAALRERDSELAYLRQTMEHNEHVIFKVHQDKERHWEQELNRLKAIHESRLKAGAQKVHKLEQLLMMQTFQLRQDKKRLIEDTNRLHDQINKLKEQNEKQRTDLSALQITEKELKESNNDLVEEIQMLRRVISDLKGKLEESEWNLCQRNGEAALMKAQLKEAQSELATKDKELITIRSDLQTWSTNDRKIDTTQVSHGRANVAVQQDIDLDMEIVQLNRIIIFKDQILVAMNNEIQKLQKELADMSLLNDYEGIPAGRYLRQHGNNTKPNNSLSSTGTTTSPCTTTSSSSEHDLCSRKLVFLNSQMGPGECEEPGYDTIGSPTSEDQIYLNSSEDDFKSLSPAQELPKVATEMTSEVTRLQTELELCRKNFEMEKEKWAQEKQKVMIYQRQLQKNYLDVLKRTHELEQKKTKS